MNLKINRKRFYDACRKALKAAAPESMIKAVPETGGILFEADSTKETLKLYCTDLNVSIMLNLKEVDVITSGKAVVSATLLTAILANYDIPGFEDIEMTVDGGMMKLSCGKARSAIHTLSVENFPNVSIAYPPNTICVSGLSQIAKQAARLAQGTEQHPEFDGIKVNFSPVKTTAVASDTTRFIRAAGEQIADGDLEVLIPKRALTLVCDITKASDEVFVGTTHNQIIFMTNEFVLTSRTLTATNHKAETLIKKVKPVYSAIVDAKQFCEAIDVSFAAIYDRDPCVSMTLKEDHLHVFVRNGDSECDIQVVADKCKPMNGEVFHYKPVFIYDFLRGCTGQVKVEFTDRGYLKLSHNLTDYIVSPRTEPKIKEPKPVKEPKVKTEPKTKKSRATKTKKEETSAEEAA
jgi:DNA polymerase III sliding clamp (beta) subunit (PCNA family)